MPVPFVIQIKRKLYYAIIDFPVSKQFRGGGGGGKTLGSSKAIKLAEYFVSNNPLLKALIAAV